MNRGHSSNKSISNGVGNFVIHTIHIVVNVISEVLVWLGAAALATICLLTVGDVSGRFLFNSPIKGTIDIIQFILLVIAIFSAIIVVTAREKNVVVDILARHLSKRVQRILSTIMYFVGFGAYALVSWQLGLSATDWAHRGLYAGGLSIHSAPFKFFAAVASGLVSLMFLRSFFRSLGKPEKTDAFSSPKRI